MTVPTVSHFAKTFAEEAHKGQLRKDGSPYFTHPNRVADLVRQYKGDSTQIESLVAAAYCHDLLEDTAITYYELVSAFGHLIASLVLELTTNPQMKRGIGNKAEYLAFKCRHMTHYALVIKLCDRLDNLTDMTGCSDNWKIRYMQETWHIIKYISRKRELTETHQEIIQDLVNAVIVVKNELGYTLVNDELIKLPTDGQ
jgi:GTP pyrophosphokinase